GAATATALLNGADESRLAASLALAATMASGIRSAFGSDGKPLQLARAAQSGYLAAILAARGMTARDTIFGPMGFLELYGVGPLRQEASAIGFGSPFGLLSPGVTIKAFPSCTATHTTIEAAIDLCLNKGVRTADVEAVEIEVGIGVPGILIHDRPDSALEGKFSIQFCYAAGLHFGRLGIAEFSDVNVRLPAIRDLYPRIRMREAAAAEPETPPNLLGVSIKTRLVDGRLLKHAISHPIGSPARP